MKADVIFTETIAKDYATAAREYKHSLVNPGDTQQPSRDFPVVRTWARSRIDQLVNDPVPDSLQAFVAWLETHPMFVSEAEDWRHLAECRRVEGKQGQRPWVIFSMPMIGLAE